MSTQAGTSGLTCEAGLDFQLPKGYKPGDFLYQDKGPWPSPPSGKYGEVAPEVLATGPHCIPKKPEWDDWNKYLYDYLYDNFLSFASSAIDYSADLLNISLSTAHKIEIGADLLAWYELDTTVDFGDRTGQYPALSDASFTELIAHGLLSKLMSELDPPDKIVFRSFLNDKTREFWKCDLTHMRVVRKTWEGEFVAPSVVLLSRPQSPPPGQEYDFRVDCIALFVQSQPGGHYDKTVILGPGDGKAWQLAKYFALQGALVRLNLIDHTMVHFPFDAINAITKSTLPKSNRVFQLLLPHLFLGLPVDNAVLEGKHSLLNRTGRFPYSPYPAAGEEICKVFPYYWRGSGTEHDAAESWAAGRDNAFPPYCFRTEPRPIPSRYGAFLNNYYKPILQFATGVVASIPAEGKEWETIRFWANHVASWIPGFPDGDTINNELLARTCASIIWNGAIVHTADHWLMHQMFEEKFPTPYIMRDAPPQSASPGVDTDYQPTVFLIDDVIPARLCDLMFFQPHSTTFLSDFKYPFQPSLDGLVAKFREALIATDEILHERFPEFGIKLDSKDPAYDSFAAGVQF